MTNSDVGIGHTLASLMERGQVNPSEGFFAPVERSRGQVEARRGRAWPSIERLSSVCGCVAGASMGSGFAPRFPGPGCGQARTAAFHLFAAPFGRHGAFRSQLLGSITVSIRLEGIMQMSETAVSCVRPGSPRLG